MKRLTYAEQLQRKLMRERLERAHVPLPPRNEVREALPVVIRQGGGPLESTIFRIYPELNGCWLWIECATTVAAGVRIEGVNLELGLGHGQLELLSEWQRSTTLPAYRFPSDIHSFLRRDVINHEFPGTLYPNRPWRGFLLAMSYQSLPPSITSLPVQLSLYDFFEREASLELAAFVDPAAPLARPPGRRGMLFEKDDDVEIKDTEPFQSFDGQTGQRGRKRLSDD